MNDYMQNDQQDVNAGIYVAASHAAAKEKEHERHEVSVGPLSLCDAAKTAKLLYPVHTARKTVASRQVVLIGF